MYNYPASPRTTTKSKGPEPLPYPVHVPYPAGPTYQATFNLPHGTFMSGHPYPINPPPAQPQHYFGAPPSYSPLPSASYPSGPPQHHHQYQQQYQQQYPPAQPSVYHQPPYNPTYPGGYPVPSAPTIVESVLQQRSTDSPLSNFAGSLYPTLPVPPTPPPPASPIAAAAAPPPYWFTTGNGTTNSIGMNGGGPIGPGGAVPPKPDLPPTPVELIVAAQNLLDRDTFSKSDPVCVLYLKEVRTGEWLEVGRTEQVKNNLNPSWNKKFLLDYHFEERQVLKFAIYDWDGSSNSLSAHDFLGSLECSLGEIVAAPNKKFERNLTLPIQFGGKTSTIQIIAEELGSNKEVVHFKVNGRKLDKKDFLGKSDPYIQIAKKLDDGTWFSVHKTEVIKNTLNPDWRPFSVRVASLTSGNPERPLRFQVYDWNSSGASDFIGEFETNYAHILSASKAGTVSFSAINPSKKAKKKSYTDSGTINFEWLRIEEEKTFLDYIQGGVQLHFTVAVDFTASNGDPNHPQSLHYRNPNFDNQYSLAIKSVGEIIQDYDSDKLFPALGFGAKIPPSAKVSHEFYLNGNPESPFCNGVAGILEAYYRSLNTVQLYGPTYFAPVIDHVARFAASYQDGKNYFILLIITDGIICDMDATKEAIINASHLPMSIIIVGVGQEDFSAMEFLDSDGRLLRHNNKIAARDIVQFVELHRFIQMYGNPTMQSGVALAKEVLAEIPQQVCQSLGRSRYTGGSVPIRSVVNTAI